MMSCMRAPFAAFVIAVITCASLAGPRVSAIDPVSIVRLPNRGVQPEVVVDAAGTVHLVYLAGEARAANVMYARSTDGGRTFTSVVRVNSQEGSAIATGTVRGAQIAVARNGRIHIVWNGSDTAGPKPPVNPKTGRTGMPMLYARSNATGTAFEPQRNLMTQTTNLDGGGSVVAIERSVYVGWHAHPASGEGGEEARRVLIARSRDEGATFSKEEPISDPATGVCGCCGLRLLAAPGGAIHALYRSATNGTGRNVYSLVSRDGGGTFESRKLYDWNIGACPMTTMAMSARSGKEEIMRAWESDGQVYYSSTDAGSRIVEPPLTSPKETARRKHPRIAVNARGDVLLVWTEGTAWAKGGSIAWQMFNADGSLSTVKGTRPDLPVWNFAAVIPSADGGFTILY